MPEEVLHEPSFVFSVYLAWFYSHIALILYAALRLLLTRHQKGRGT
jgi:hypothetical protein